MSDAAALRAAADRCVACAACRTGCPTFDATLEEGRSGRGRVQLVRSALSGALDAGSDRFSALLSSCTRCGFCAEICPVGIPVVAIVDYGRALSEARRPRALRERIVLKLLLRPPLLRFALRALALWQRVLGRARDGTPASLPGLGTRKPIFRLPWSGAVSGAAGPSSGPPVALRVGCRTDALAPRAADDAAFLLRRAGFLVDVPGGQGCGGAFAAAAGDAPTTAALKSLSEATFAGTRTLSMCGSCDRTPDAHGGEDWLAALAERGFAGPFAPSRLPGPVVVHEPCTARYGPGKGSGVFALLRSAGVDARLLTGVACCGGAAPFCLDAPQESAELGRLAAAAAAAAGGGRIVSSDPGCLLQFATYGGTDAASRPQPLHAATALRMLVDPERLPP